MPEADRYWSDERLDQVLGNLLRYGVLLAGGVVLIGAVLYLLHHGREAMPPYGQFEGASEEYRHLGTIVAAAGRGHARGIIQLGLLLLIATPIARVVFSVFAFAVQRDYTYVVVTLIVLTVLLYSLLTGGQV